jgi:hypothetical protein
MQSFNDYYYDRIIDDMFCEARRRRKTKELDVETEIAEIEGRLSELVHNLDPQGQLGKKPSEKLDNLLDIINVSLDVIGFIPGFEFIDLINMLIYATRGKWGDAAISAVSAIPLLDLVKLLKAKKGTKAAKMALKFIKPAHKYLKVKGSLKVMPKIISGTTKAAKGLKLGRGIYNSQVFLNKYFKKYLNALNSIIPYAKFATKAGEIEDIGDLSKVREID